MGAMLWIAAGFGHLAIWSWFFNRTHATVCPRFWRKVIEKLIVLLVLLPLLWFAWQWFGGELPCWREIWTIPNGWLFYAACCAAVGPYFVGAWMVRRIRYRLPRGVRLGPRDYVRVKQVLNGPLEHGWFARCLSLIPGNQSTHLSVEQSEICRLPGGSRFDGLRIAHLSDFHWTGALDRRYFRYVIERVNDWKPDLLVLTGDFVDEAHCLDWIEPLLAPLVASQGKFYVLGNHDRRMSDESDLRRRLHGAGLRQAAGSWCELEFKGALIRIAGNELPWYRPATAAAAVATDRESLTIALMHSPDQLDWARKLNCDLAFAGHLHGGQICLPLIGPIIAPSRFGVRYTNQFHEMGKGLLIVSRGLSGDEPIRICCPPQVGFYTLKSLPIDPRLPPP